MAIYRVKHSDETQETSELINQADEFWKERHEWQHRDLDFEEIDNLNATLEDDFTGQEKKENSKLKILHWSIVLILIFTFVYWTLPSLSQTSWNFSILSKSYELSQEETIMDLNHAVVKIETATASGSGFNICEDGLIVTNLHVVEDSDYITVYFNKDVNSQAFIVRNYIPIAGADLALIDIDGENLPFVELSDADINRGDEVIFIGNPLGFNWTISEGRVNGIVMIEDISCLYLSGPIAEGSSGSPVFNKKSQVIGIIFASVRGEENSGLAIPTSYLIQALEELSNE